MIDKNNSELYDKLATCNAVTEFYIRADLYDWDGVRELMCDEVQLLMGDEDAGVDLIPLDTFMENLVARNAGYGLGKAGTFHGDFAPVATIDGDTALVRCKCMAAHWLSDDIKDYAQLLGMYFVNLVRSEFTWKIQRIWIKPIRIDGDVGRVMSVAAENWAKQNK